MSEVDQYKWSCSRNHSETTIILNDRIDIVPSYLDSYPSFPVSCCFVYKVCAHAHVGVHTESCPTLCDPLDF